MACEFCNCSTFTMLGYLGNTAYLRCRNCGANASTDAATLDNEDEE